MLALSHMDSFEATYSNFSPSRIRFLWSELGLPVIWYFCLFDFWTEGKHVMSSTSRWSLKLKRNICCNAGSPSLRWYVYGSVIWSRLGASVGVCFAFQFIIVTGRH